MAIGGQYFDTKAHIDFSILRAMAAICSIVLKREVKIEELPYLYEHDYTCRMEMAYVIG